MVAAVLLIAAHEVANCQTIATFHPQFNNKRTTSWEMCVSNRGSSNTTFSMADLYRITAGRMNILNASSRAYEMRMRPRNRWIRGIQITAAIASLLQATPAIQIGDSWQYLFPGIAGGLQIAQPAIEANRRQDFEMGVYWDGSRTLAGGESQCAMVMSLKVKNPQSFAAIVSVEIPLPGGAAGGSGPLPEAPPLEMVPVLPPPSPVSMHTEGAERCLSRPSSVVQEDDLACPGGFYG